VYANNIRGTARPQSSDIYLRGHLKPSYTEQQFKIKKHLKKRIFGCLSNH